VKRRCVAFLGERLDTPTGEVSTSLGRVWAATVFEVRIVIIGDHDLSDDQGLKFASYPVQVAFAAYSDAAERPSSRALCRALAGVLASAVSELGASVIVVEELSKVLETLGPSFIASN